MAYIRTENLTVGYNGAPLIRDICMELNRGQILTLIGPNGAGKSTILKSITRQLATLGGTVVLDGADMQKIDGKTLSRKLSVMLTSRVHPELMTCEDVVAAGRYPYTGRLGVLSVRDREAVRESMELVHALDLGSCDFNQISDGQRQRILLAKAICQEPEFIVLDEPTSFLDIRHKLELLTMLKNLVLQKRLAVVLSLHELDLAQKISDLVVCVHGDRIERTGTPEEIFTADYIHELYEMTNGSYNADFGCLEMEAPKGEPQVFVIGGNGSGIGTYRRLAREGVPFAAGVLHENDIDCAVAKALATAVVTERPFEPIGEAAFQNALRIARQCRKVICCVREFGSMNEANRRLARETGSKAGDIA